MDGARLQPLSVAEAKRRLRQQTEAASLRGMLTRHPYAGLSASALLGFVLARNPRLLALLGARLGRLLLC